MIDYCNLNEIYYDWNYCILNISHILKNSLIKLFNEISFYVRSEVIKKFLFYICIISFRSFHHFFCILLCFNYFLFILLTITFLIFLKVILDLHFIELFFIIFDQTFNGDFFILISFFFSKIIITFLFNWSNIRNWFIPTILLLKLSHEEFIFQWYFLLIYRLFWKSNFFVLSLLFYICYNKPFSLNTRIYFSLLF